jgi:hypothetical protein
MTIDPIEKEKAETWMNFLWKNTLNFQEYGTNIAYKLIMDIGFERQIQAFGLNPVAMNVVRDISGFPSVITHAYNGFEVGNSGIITDVGFVMFSATKITCKTGLIASYITFVDPNAFTSPASLSIVGRAGNYICDPLGGIWRQASIERQETKETDQNFFYWFYQNAKSDWVSKAFIGGIPKVFLSDMLGEGFRYIGYKDTVKEAANQADTYIVKTLLPETIKEITLTDDLWSKIFNIFDSQNPISYLASGAMMMTTIIDKIVEDIVPAFTICTGSRSIQSYLEVQTEAYFGNQTYHNTTNLFPTDNEL